jgi:hypothetical protein
MYIYIYMYMYMYMYIYILLYIDIYDSVAEVRPKLDQNSAME